MSVGDTNDGPRTYYHFTNTVSGDAAFNVLSTLNTSSYIRPYVVDTIPGSFFFTVNVDYTMRRYDDLDEINVPEPVRVEFTIQLTDTNTGASIPLISSNASPFIHPTISKFLGTSPKTPSEKTIIDTFFFRHSGQLDAISHSNLLLDVTIRHKKDNPEAIPSVTGNTYALGPTHLLHFNGTLMFGGIPTTLSAITNTPIIGGLTPGGLQVDLGVAPDGGTLDTDPSRTYGNGSNLTVTLDSSGNASLFSGFIGLSSPLLDTGVLANISFRREDLILIPQGAEADFVLDLPTGLGHSTNSASKCYEPTLVFTSVVIGAGLVPTTTVTEVGIRHFTEETKPFTMPVNKVAWDPDAGELELFITDLHYVRRDELQELDDHVANLFIPPFMAVKPSNEQYYRYIQPGSENMIVRADSNGNAMVSGPAEMDPGDFPTHFPLGIDVSWQTDGQLFFTNDLLDPLSSYVQDPDPLDFNYAQSCAGCGDEFESDALTLTSRTGRIYFTLDGGLHVDGLLTNSYDLQWGYAPNSFAQNVYGFTEGNFYASGHFLRGDQDLVFHGGNQGPGVILNTGVLTNDLSQTERPGTSGYVDGFGDYPGLNFRVGVTGAHQAMSRIGDKVTPLYDLVGRSKYYIRKRGVTGIHQAHINFPNGLIVYGYDFTFDKYGLNYISSRNRDSRTDGSVYLPYPSDFTMPFEEMKFSCIGDMTRPDLPAFLPEKNLAYWDAPFDTHCFRIETADECAITQSVLVACVTTHGDHIDNPLFGDLGFQSNGNLIAESFGMQGINSRLSIPNELPIDGPGGDTYSLMPVSLSYLNDHASAGALTQSAAGFINYAGTLDVLYFENLLVQVHSGAGTNDDSSIYMTGGWPDAGWSIDTTNFFTVQTFDVDNRAYPAAAGSITNYRAQANSDYQQRGKQIWLGTAHFNFPLLWDTATRSFRSATEISTELLVLETDAQVDYLGPIDLELAFGRQYGDVPRVNIANMRVNGESPVSGVASALSDATDPTLLAALSDGLDGLNEILHDQAREQFDVPFDTALDPLIDALYVVLSNDYAVGADYYSEPIDEHVRDVGGGAPAENINTALDAIASNLAERLDADMADVTDFIDAFIGQIGPHDGLLTRSGESFTVLPGLGVELMQVFASDAAAALGAGLEEQIDNQLLRLEGPLEAADDAFEIAQDHVSELRNALGVDGGFRNELAGVVDSATIDQVTLTAADGIKQRFSRFNPRFSPFDEHTRDELKTMMRREIEDAFFGSLIPRDTHAVIRAWSYDLDSSIRSAGDSVFHTLNRAMRNVLSSHLAHLDNDFDDLIGDLDDVVSHSQMEGYAHINGNAFDALRLDGRLAWEIPLRMEFPGYIEIIELDPMGPDGCMFESGIGSEAKIGADGIEIDWVWAESARFDIYADFTFNNGVSKGFGGGIDMVGGRISFEVVTINDLSADLAVGELETYFANLGDITIEELGRARGGFYFGKACTLDPILRIDPDADIGNPPFTGVYLFGAGRGCIADLGCFLEICAKMSHAYWFCPDSDTYGARVTLGASGEGACLISIDGSQTLYGGLVEGELAVAGSLRVSGRIGSCPFCTRFRKTVSLKYRGGEWDADL